MNEDLELDDQAEETEIFDEIEDDPLNFKYSITSYGADYPVDGIVSRLNSNKIIIPSFQRQYVWKLNQASRFIESLILELPVPGVFLSKDPDSSNLLVIDGQQRLKTIQFFVNGIFANEKKFRLKGVQPQFDNISYQDLDEDTRTAFNDYVIHATVIRQDEPTNDQSSIYHIFERLNTGGTPLQPQEIRACIFYGEFNDLINELNNNPKFRDIYGKKNNRLKDQELILRFLALYFNSQKYEKPLKGFLNMFMGDNRHLQKFSRTQIIDLFESTISIFHETLGNSAFRIGRVINTAFYDAIMVGVAKRLEKGPITNKTSFLQAYSNILENKELQGLIKGGTSDEKNIERRIEIAILTFQNIE
jgi:uncharacterized protein with ParB-like and HNH nuclease domain